MPRTRGTVVIARPLEVVFDFVADVRNQPSYKPLIVRVDTLTAHGVGVGTRWSALLRGARWPATVVIERTEYERPHILGSTMTTPDAEVALHVTFEPVAGGTRVSWDERTRPTKGARLGSSLAVFRLARRERADWRGLRTLLESLADVPARTFDTARAR